MAYDTKCHDLACHFLEDEPKLNSEHKRSALAQTIQTAIEEWIEWEERNMARLAAFASTQQSARAEKP